MRKVFVLLWSINQPNFIVRSPLLCEILGKMSIAIACAPGFDVMNFKVNLIFLIKQVFPTRPKCRDKNINILRKKRANQKKIFFFNVFKGLSNKQMTQILLEGESPTLIPFVSTSVLFESVFLVSILNYFRKNVTS